MTLPPARQRRLRCPICPDFLRRFVALRHSMRLSLMKGAHADLSSTAWQEIGVKPGFGLSGIPQHSTRLFVIPTEAQCRDLRFLFSPSDLTAPNKSHHPPLVIPSAAEGPAVRPGSRTKASVPLVLPQNRKRNSRSLLMTKGCTSSAVASHSSQKTA